MQVCLATTTTVFIVNLILTIWATSTLGLQAGFSIVQEGDCEKTKRLSQWLHLAINILSTLLLGASNYCMQCISSPTRSEVDEAHIQGRWLDIGIVSVRNIRRIKSPRIRLWWLLAVSSIPLHLLYNSAVFASLATREYDVAVVSRDWINGAPFNVDDGGAQERIQRLQNDQSLLQNLSNAECVQAYANPIVTRRSNVVLVTALPSDENNSVLNLLPDIRPGFDFAARYSGFDYPSASAWTCFTKPHCNYTIKHNYVNEDTPTNWDTWSSNLASVDYCLSEREEDHCKLEFSIAIMIIVIICNGTKALCIGLLVWKKDLRPLTTLGDAIASFLEEPDSATKGQCMKNQGHFKNSHDWEPSAHEWHARRQKWFSAASPQRWMACNSLCALTLLIGCILLGIGIQSVRYNGSSTSLSALAALGFGSVRGEALITANLQPGKQGGIIGPVLLANLPQLILSFLYLTYNGLFTCMLHAEEWGGYAEERKPLRVTSPKGRQRDTYRLQLPYRYGVPLLIMSGLLHWLVSQSIFLARISTLRTDGTVDNTQSISTCGYSPIAIITVIIVGSLIVLLGIANGFRRYKPGMPLVGSCSAAISAACHRPEGDADAHLKPVMWGVVADPSPENAVGHCTFTSYSVEKPVDGRLYAG